MAPISATIAAELKDSFGLMLDEWTSHFVHFLDVYAVYTVGDERHSDCLLRRPWMMADGGCACRPPGSGSERLQQDDRDGNLLSATTGRLGDEGQIPLVGCASHRFNLAVNRFMEV